MAGSYVHDNSALLIVDSCQTCPRGKYSTSEMLDTQCRPCEAGYLCYGNTNRKEPTILEWHNGERCPKGHYCLEGSYKETPCYPGTYNEKLGAKALTECLLCDADSYNDLFG